MDSFRGLSRDGVGVDIKVCSCLFFECGMFGSGLLVVSVTCSARRFCFF